MTTVPATTRDSSVRLLADGLGIVSFGAPADAAAIALRNALGVPESDTTVVADLPDGLGGPRTTLRTLRWGQLAVSFVDWTGSPYRSDGTLHLVRWLVSGETNDGRVYATSEGIRIGSSVAQLREAYGSSMVVERDDCVGAWQIRVGNPSLGVVGRLDSSPENANARLVYLAAGLRSSC
ncbi:MAG TPA: hypothetical protein VM282_10495 [Acidimicrobiales bacterium]|nr:hypothetical protein [Acidimicrobiales bacterium]